MSKNKNNIKIAYLSGPVNAVEVFDNRKVKQKQPYFGTSYMSQFFDLIEDNNFSGFVVTSLVGQQSVTVRDNVKISNIPRDYLNSGISYHVYSALWLFRALFQIVLERPKYLIATDAQNYWFLLFPARMIGIKIIGVYHCTLWSPYKKQNWHQAFLIRLNSVFLNWCVQSIATASETISGQIRSLKMDRKVAITEFLPTYDHSQFALIDPPRHHDGSTVNVLFAGRVESNKGIYDFCELAKVLIMRYPGRFNFHICGEGTELQNVKAAAQNSCYENRLFVHGFCAQAKMIEIFSLSHIVVVPTRSDFEEGFAMICAEAILAGRPLVTSAACPALTVLRSATIEAHVDNVDSYIAAVEQLANDQEIYEQKRGACQNLQPQFYDKKNSWYAKINQMIS